MSKTYHYTKVSSIPIYHGVFIWMLSNDNKKIEKRIKNFDEEPFAHCLELSWSNKYGVCILLNFNNNYGAKISYGTIAHEAVHAASFILDSRGVVPDFNNDEPQAYLVEYIVNEIIKFVKAKGFKIDG